MTNKPWCLITILILFLEAAMSIATDVRRVPNRLFKIVVADRSEYYPAPNYRQYGGSGRPSQYLQASTDIRKM
jgi:hypothetical protein